MRGQIRVGRLCWDLAKIGSDSTNLCFWLLTIERLQFWRFLQMYEIAWSISELAECCEQSVPLLDRQTTNKTGGNETKASQIGLEMKVRADEPELQIRAARRSELVRASLKFQNARALNFSDGFPRIFQIQRLRWLLIIGWSLINCESLFSKTQSSHIKPETSHLLPFPC